VGPGLARRIVEERQRRGRFEGPEGLRSVLGLGPRKLAALRDLVTATPWTWGHGLRAAAALAPLALDPPARPRIAPAGQAPLVPLALAWAAGIALGPTLARPQSG
jgi:hypothetical protein